MRRAFALLLIIDFGACTSPKTAPPEPPPPAAPAPVAASAPASSPIAPHDAAPPTLSADASPPLPTAASCAADADCRFDDPCAPTTCGKRDAATAAEKCKTNAAVGECRCAAGKCAFLKEEKERDADHRSCQSDTDCAFDATAGVCVAGSAGASVGEGIACQCDTLNHWCKQIWVGDVPCKSYRDCSWRSPGDHATVPSWFAPRHHKNPVRPCKDGEVDSVCTNGTCEIRAWKC